MKILPVWQEIGAHHWRSRLRGFDTDRPHPQKRANVSGVRRVSEVREFQHSLADAHSKQDTQAAVLGEAGRQSSAGHAPAKAKHKHTVSHQICHICKD